MHLNFATKKKKRRRVQEWEETEDVKKANLFQRLSIQAMISRIYSSQLCSTSFAKYADESLIISSQFLLSCFIKSLCIILSQLMINFSAFMARYTHICMQELNPVIIIAMNTFYWWKIYLLTKKIEASTSN